jgi:hypothetical protein
LIEIVMDSASGRREARISDLSTGGCFIDSIVSVTQGEAVAFELVNGEGRSLLFKSEVIYVLPGVGFGVRFTDVTEEQRSFLNELVEHVANPGVSA